MLQLKGNGYTTEDKVFLTNFLGQGLQRLASDAGCPTGNLCPICPCRNACADLFRLYRYLERMDIR